MYQLAKAQISITKLPTIAAAAAMAAGAIILRKWRVELTTTSDSLNQ